MSFFTPRAWLITTVAVALALFGILMACVINPNRFSLHAMYRDRLIRAYLGASNRERNPNPFTGFDEKDNPRMHGLWREEKFHAQALAGGQCRAQPRSREQARLAGTKSRQLHGFTASLRLVCSRLPQDRCVAGQRYGSEKTLRRRCGRRSRPKGPCYGGQEGISLGTAIAISGAAASPNMGYHSSPLVTFILTLLNVRLGAWLGNPGPAGDNTFHLGYPKFSVRPLIAEAFGLTDESNRYVYLSDGGHFENLGLYEMVLRRCHYIVVSDAGQDPACSFADLGGAVRKIRIDLGIPIEFRSRCRSSRASDEIEDNKRTVLRDRKDPLLGGRSSRMAPKSRMAS